jgi:hypothetical protein
MQIVKPLPITAAEITATNVAEDDAPAYDAGATYDSGDRVIHDHRVFEALKDGLVGVTPVDGTDWLLISATNRHKPFDYKILAQAEHADAITYTIAPGARVDTVTFFGLEAESVRVVMTDPTEGVVYDRTDTLVVGDGVVDAWTYCFLDVRYARQVTFRDLPPYAVASLAITISRPGDTARVGQIGMGVAVPIGHVTYGTGGGIRDWSRKEADQFGQTRIVERPYAPRIRYRVAIDPAENEWIRHFLGGLRATPAIYMAATGTESWGTTLLGLFRDFNVPFEAPTVSFLTIEVESLT